MGHQESFEPKYNLQIQTQLSVLNYGTSYLIIFFFLNTSQNCFKKILVKTVLKITPSCKEI